MNWKDYCKGFAIQRNYSGWETKCLTTVAVLNKIPFRGIRNPDYVEDGWIPSGTVAWVSSVLGENITPNYFPKFLKKDWVKRKVWYQEKWSLQKVFIKPADKYKRFDGFITSGGWDGKKRGPYWCSEVVKFIDEWRYYIAYGKVIGGYWYLGIDDDPKSTPELNIKYPDNWCGTADFGRLEDGDIELIECHSPFACGWYGKNHEEYAEFLTLGWKWLTEKSYKETF
jgi:hypothetical protein